MLLIALLSTAMQLPAAQEPTWHLGGAPSGSYVLGPTSGSVLQPRGAAVSLRSVVTPPNAYGTVSSGVMADQYRGRRVRIEADIDVKNVTIGASPWIRVDGPNGMLAIDNGLDRAVKGTGTEHRAIDIYVPNDAKLLAFGLILSGPGEATARSLRVFARPLGDANAPLPVAARAELDSAIAIARRAALWRDTVTWSAVEHEVRTVAAGSETAAEVHPAIRLLLARLGDHHSFLMQPTGAQQFKTGGAQNPRAMVKLLPGEVGYVLVPGYSGAEPNALKAYAQAMHDSIAGVAFAAGCRWIDDLRTNTGGNMWPMLGGLRPFFGDAGLGSFVTAKGNDPLWHAGDAVNVTPPPSLASLDSANVAVLTGPRTASSGEAVTISFIGRPHTRLFGLPTAGLSTANQSFTLPDSSMIFLTVSVEADRTGKRYGEKIQPDEIIPAAGNNGSDDPQLARALAWLASQSCHP